MNDDIQLGPIYKLKTRYRAHKLKVVLYILLQTISVVFIYLLVIYVDEYRNIPKLSVGKMDYSINFVDDTNIKMDGSIEVHSPLSTTFYLKEVYVNIFIDTESDIEKQKEVKYKFNDYDAPPITIHVPFNEPQLIRPGRAGKKTATKLKITGEIIPKVIPTLIKKIEANIAGKLRRFRFLIYPTFELRISFLTFIINTSLQKNYNFEGKGIPKEIKEVKATENPFTDKMSKVFNAVQLSTHISLNVNPFRVSGIQFKYFFICFKNNQDFCFKGELKELDLFPLCHRDNQLITLMPNHYNFNTIIEFTRLDGTIYEGVNYIYSILSLKNYCKTFPLTKINMIGKWGDDYWTKIDSRNTFTAYRDFNLKFTIGNAKS